MANMPAVGTLQVPTHRCREVQKILTRRNIGTHFDPLPDSFYQELQLFTTEGNARTLAKIFRDQTLPFHLEMCDMSQIYGAFTSPTAYQVTSLPMGVLGNQMDWENQEHIHKQQKVLALLDS